VKILAISHLFPHEKEKRYGIFVARQLSEMAKQGAEVTVVVPRVWCPALLRRFQRWKDYDHKVPLCHFDGLDAISVPYLRPPGNWYNRFSGLVAFQAIKEKVLQLHEERRFDIIYATDFFPDGDAAVRLALYIKIPAACLAIGVDVNVTAHTSNMMYRHFVRTAQALDGMLACGYAVADGLHAITEKHPLCVYGVIDLQEFSPISKKSALRKEIGLPADKLIALYAGYLIRRKGIYELVEAFSKIRKKGLDIMLVMCGSGPEESALKALIREKNIEDAVRMVGEVEPEQMSKWMQVSDLFVLATHTEGMPNVVMEAMACGVPVIATAVGGLPAAIGDCEGAILVPPKNIDAFVEAIMGIANDSKLRKRMQKAARKKAEQDFGIEQNAHRILNYLKQVIEEGKSKYANQ
jgi:teichuronic acid biosynthesis glycosyltransferase TuaC